MPCDPLPDNRYYPVMYVRTEDLLKRRNYFLRNKKEKFINLGIDVPAQLFCSANAFCSFLKKIKSNYAVLSLFFAVDDDNSLTVVFGPAQKNEKPVEYYYLEDGDFVLDDGRVGQWITKYQGIFSCLDGTYDKDQYSPNDTRGIQYEMNNFEEIGGEINYQQNDNNYSIRGIGIWFSSYTDLDKDSVIIPIPKIIRKRLIVQFVLIYDNGGTDEVLYIDTLGDGRSPAPLRMDEFDTGNICPPRCGGIYP